MGLDDRSYMRDHVYSCDCAYCRGQRRLEEERQAKIQKALEVIKRAYEMYGKEIK